MKNEMKANESSVHGPRLGRLLILAATGSLDATPDQSADSRYPANPFQGIGQPEMLRYGLSGSWSRRIDLEHRIIYRVADETLVVLQCRYHY